MRMSFRRRPSGWLLATALGLLVGASDARAGGPEKVTTVEGITEYRLDNGLRVLLFPDPTRPKVTVNLTVLVGSRHEGYGETGMAHLLEHMLFKGTPTHPDIPAVMKERGAQFNGSTYLDRTNYYETLPASDENLEFALRLEADRMINSPIKPEHLATEFSVVRNEFEAGENSPRRILSQRMKAVAYEWHNYGKSTIGNRADIERVPVDNLRAFYKRFYQPDNAVLVVAGKFDEKKALSYIEKYFGSIPRPDRKLQDTYTEEPAQDGERFVTLRRVGSVGLVGVLYHVPAGPHAEFAAVEILTEVLGSEPSGRLYKALVETRKASSVSASAQPFHDPGTLDITAEVNTQDRSELEKVRDIIFSVVDQVERSGVTQEEVDRARQSILKDRELSLHDPNDIAVELSEWAAQGDWRLFFLHRDRIEKVTPAEVKEAAAKYLVASNRTVGFFLPSAKPERTPIPETPDVAKLLKGYAGRKSESASGETFDVSPAAIEARVQRPDAIGGVKLALLPKKSRGSSVQMRLTLRFGNAENLKGFIEAGRMLPELMTRGTKSMTRQQIEDALDKNFARLGGGMGGRMMRVTGGAGAGSVTFALETKRANLPAVLEILRQILREPTLPQDEFEVLKREDLTAIEQGRTQPMNLAFNRFQRAFAPYPSDDVRYVPTIDERLERTRNLSIEQVRTLYREFLGAAHGELVMIGDFEPSEVLPILGKTLDGWKAGKPYARIERPIPPGLKPETATIETPDKPNAVYVAGLVDPVKDSDPDYPAMVIGDYILGGGGLSSRIANRLRQKDGVSYNAMSMFAADPLDSHAALMILAIYNPINVQKVKTGVIEEVDRLLKGRRRTARGTGSRPRKDGLSPAGAEPAGRRLATRLNPGRGPLPRPDDGIPGRSRAEDPRPHPRSGERRPPQVHRSGDDSTVVTAGDFQKK